jgi:DNA-binding MarR family transcriptional regulator
MTKMKVKTADIRALIDANINLRTAMKQFVQARIREDKLNITYEMLQVMAVLWNRGDMNQQDIADSILKNKASLTSLLDNLTKRNLVIRTEDPSDRRNKIISLTKAGREFESQLQPLLDGFYDTLQTGLSSEEIKKVTGLLIALHRNLLG